MNLIQYLTDEGRTAVAVRRGKETRPLSGPDSVYAFTRDAVQQERSLEDAVDRLELGAPLDLEALYARNRLQCPITHPDPARLIITGTGLTHLGSASARDAMHGGIPGEHETDTMRMFRWGVEGGKPESGDVGVQPEWFYKGSGLTAVAPGHPIHSPGFAEDAGEEPEIAGIYLIDEDGQPVRLGFALANEFSDHVMERRNYLYLAHSKLRPCSFGPELMTGLLPDHVQGRSKILRDGVELWSREFLSGEANMSHTIANLEHHHFKYPQFRRPGDIHVHMFGTATLSFADQITLKNGDLMEVAAAPFGLPLRNPLAVDPADDRPLSIRPFSTSIKEST